MSKQTLAFEYMKLYGPKTIQLVDKLEDYSRIPEIKVTLLKEDLRKFTDNYKVMLEFCQEFFEKKDIDIWDFVKYHNEDADTRIYGMSMRTIRRLKNFYVSKTGDLSLSEIKGDSNE